MNNSVSPSAGQSAIVHFSSVNQHYHVDSVSVNSDSIDCVLVQDSPAPWTDDSVNIEYRNGQWFVYDIHDDGVSRVYFTPAVDISFE